MFGSGSNFGPHRASNLTMEEQKTQVLALASQLTLLHVLMSLRLFWLYYSDDIVVYSKVPSHVWR